MALFLPGFIVVHDSETVHKKKKPEGTAIKIRTASIDYIRPYKRGGCTLAIHGVYLHVTENAEVVERMMLGVRG